MVELVKKLVEHNKSYLKLLPKAGRKIIKIMKYNYRVARRVYESTYANMTEQCKIHLNSLLSDNINETENDFRANGNCPLSVCQTESSTELFDSFAMFYYISSRFPYTDWHLFIPNSETLSGIIKEKLSLKELFAKIFRTGSNGLVSSPFLAALLLFFAGKETLPEKDLTELYKNLTGEVLSSDSSENLKFHALTDLFVEIGVKLENFIFSNHEREKLGMKKLPEEISKKCGFFDDEDDKKKS